MIPYFRLKSNPKELEELTKVQQSSSWVNGEYIGKVEDQLKKLFHKQHAVLTSNGSSALFVALRSLGIEGQQVIVPAVSTCFAITNAVISSGNTPVFCDIDMQDGNCDVEHVSKLVKQSNITCIVSPNFAGNISAVKEFKKIGLTVIEDACQSFHSSTFHTSEADIQVFSFYPTKGMNGIDGGALLLNDPSIAQNASKLVYFDDQINFESAQRYNFRFLNAHAAVLHANLTSFRQIQERLIEIGSVYKTAIAKMKGLSLLENSNTKVFQRFVIHVNEAYKTKLTDAFKAKEIALSPFFIWNCKKEHQTQLSAASELESNTFCLPYFEDLTKLEQNSVIETLQHVFT